jgi:hypothetical protein
VLNKPNERINMSKLASVTFTTQLQDKPEGVIVGGFLVALVKAGAVVDSKTVADNAAPVEFNITTPGDYTVQVTRVAESGENISPTVSSDQFTVAPDQILVPLAVTVTVGDLMAVPAQVTVA